MRRLFVVYNTASSRAATVKEKVLEPLRGLKGWMVGKFEVKAPTVDENAAELARILKDGDLVIAAGGDGTAAIAANGAMLSRKDVTLGVLGYGNFNDMAKMLGMREVGEIVQKFETGEVSEIYPLEILVNGKRWRYAPCYVTFGLFAESTEVFDEAKVRKKLQAGKRSPIFSWWTLAKWYFRNRKSRVFIPKFKLNGVAMLADTTDYVAVNGSRMAGVMRGGDWYLAKEGFGRATGRLRSFWRLFWLMVRSVLKQVPVTVVEKDILEFDEPGALEVQAEGEYQRLTGVTKIEIRKAERGIKVVRA